MRAETRDDSYRFIAVRLPYGVQADEDDAQKALAFIQPDVSLTVNIKESADAMTRAVEATGAKVSDFSENCEAIIDLKYIGDNKKNYHFIVDKDTIDVSDMRIDRVDKNKLKISIYQGNRGHYQYDFILKERPFLAKIFILDQEEKLDSILINHFLPINDKEQHKIDSFINQND